MRVRGRVRVGVRVRVRFRVRVRVRSEAAPGTAGRACDCTAPYTWSGLELGSA